jgi:integration host factor subunit beta
VTKADIVEKIAEKTGLNKREAFLVVDLLIEDIKKALSEGDKVELRGFGSFKVKKRNPRKARNPRTGETVNVPAKLIPFFKVSKALKEKVNSKS